MTFIDKIGKPILDVSSPMPTITSLHDHFYRRAHEANWPEEKIQCIWNSFSEMMNSWFTLEELQDNKRLSKNKRLMELIVLMQLPVPFENKEDRVNRIAMAIELSLPSTIKYEFATGERICGYQDDLREFLHHLCERTLLGDEAKKMKTILLSASKSSGVVKYAEQKILLAGIHQALGVYWMEQKICKSPVKVAEDTAICEFWNIAIWRALGILDR